MLREMEAYYPTRIDIAYSLVQRHRVAGTRIHGKRYSCTGYSGGWRITPRSYLLCEGYLGVRISGGRIWHRPNSRAGNIRNKRRLLLQLDLDRLKNNKNKSYTL